LSLETPAAFIKETFSEKCKGKVKLNFRPTRHKINIKTKATTVKGTDLKRY
jgi:hypothetical protein